MPPMRLQIRRIFWGVLAIGGLALLVYAFIPRPIEVDVGIVDRGQMQVSVDQEGKTRVRDRYLISAPLAGQLERIEWKAGDVVMAGQTVLARIQPTLPSLLDVRAREEAAARVGAAEAALQRAGPVITRAEAELAQARVQFARTSRLAEQKAVSQQEFEDKKLAVDVREAELNVAQSAQAMARYELEQARAALLRFDAPADTRPAVFEIHSPIDGQVLRVIQESSLAVSAATPLLEVGDVGQLEAVIDVLSRDAVKIRPGAKVFLERWGGDIPLEGIVRRIEPSGFTKISALGVEEQRVNVIADFSLPSDQRQLGDYYRVDARIITWEQPDVLRVPGGALFRAGEHWAVYVVESGRALQRTISVGRMNGTWAEVLDGLNEDDAVILHPSDKVRHSVRVIPRDVSAD